MEERAAMFGMGLQEILVILVVAVLVIGPDQLPKVARTMGQLMAQFKRATNDLREAVNREMSEHEELREINKFKDDVESEVRTFRSTAKDYLDEEVRKGEEELERAEKLIVPDNGDPGVLQSADSPASEAAPAADAAPETKADTAVAGDAAGAEPPPSSDGGSPEPSAGDAGPSVKAGTDEPADAALAAAPEADPEGQAEPAATSDLGAVPRKESA
jgi:Tat protein translocase TatB subunit